jgi:hypothetical protein
VTPHQPAGPAATARPDGPGALEWLHQTELTWSASMGIWIELGIFLLVFVFALHQFHDLKKERLKRELQRERERKDDPVERSD